MSKRKVYTERVEIRLNPKLKKVLDSHATKTQITTSELIRRILACWMEGDCY